MELIYKRDALHAVLHNECQAAVAAVENIKAVDAVPVVRCKDCKYYKPWDDETYGNCKVHSGALMKDWYCSLGERKDGERDERTD